MFAIIRNNKIFAACQTEEDVAAYLNDFNDALSVAAPSDFKTYEYKYVEGSLIKKTSEDYEKEFALIAALQSRVAEYPPVGDQLDALWKGGEAAAEMLAKVQAVKAKYPKPE